MYSAGIISNKTVLELTNLAQGTHSIKVEFTGAKNPAANSNIVLIDAFEIINGDILS